MEVVRLVQGVFQTNTYLLIDDDQVVIIDPTGKYGKLKPYLENKHVLAVLLTHGHFDHIGLVDDLYDMYHMPIYLHDDDLIIATNPKYNTYGPLTGTIKSPIKSLNEGTLKIGPFSFEIIHTSGHTQGSVVIIIDKYMFTGDTLFKGSVGRTDLYGGDQRDLLDSLKYLKTINHDYIVYPGHDASSTFFEELKNNPYLNR